MDMMNALEYITNTGRYRKVGRYMKDYGKQRPLECVMTRDSRKIAGSEYRAWCYLTL